MQNQKEKKMFGKLFSGGVEDSWGKGEITYTPHKLKKIKKRRAKKKMGDKTRKRNR